MKYVARVSQSATIEIDHSKRDYLMHDLPVSYTESDWQFFYDKLLCWFSWFTDSAGHTLGSNFFWIGFFFHFFDPKLWLKVSRLQIFFLNFYSLINFWLKMWSAEVGTVAVLSGHRDSLGEELATQLDLSRTLWYFVMWTSHFQLLPAILAASEPISTAHTGSWQFPLERE